MFNWPENILPLPSPDFSVSNSFNVAETRMDSGRRRLRPRNTKPLAEASIQLELTRFQYAFFVAIWNHKLNNGTDWFYMRLPAPNDESLTLQRIRFVGDYSADHRQHENWNISVNIEFFEQASFSQEYIDLYILYDGDLDRAQSELSLIHI